MTDKEKAVSSVLREERAERYRLLLQQAEQWFPWIKPYLGPGDTPETDDKLVYYDDYLEVHADLETSRRLERERDQAVTATKVLLDAVEDIGRASTGEGWTVEELQALCRSIISDAMTKLQELEGHAHDCAVALNARHACSCRNTKGAETYD